MLDIYKILDRLIKFRSLMGLSLSKEKVKYIWGKQFLKEIQNNPKYNLEELENEYAEEKLNIAREYVPKLKFLNLVKFIGVSGSVAAGFAKKDDDIDIFVVVRNDTMWIYRAFMVLFGRFNRTTRLKNMVGVNNKICLNLIAEERGLEFTSDMFNFHELVYLYPIYKQEYIKRIYSQNKWMQEEYGMKKENFSRRDTVSKRGSIFLKVLNSIFFIGQYLFMVISRHEPEFNRLRENNRKGRIEFFPYEFKDEKLRVYSKEFKSTN